MRRPALPNPHPLPSPLVPRLAVATLQRMARGFPVLAVTGPRQSGKTTVARLAFSQLPYVNLEDPDTRELALADPRRFFARHAQGAILDEVQRAPVLPCNRQVRVRPGRG